MSTPREDEELRVQREVTSIALRALGQTPFVLAGSGAIREHGITARPTEDIDLFTNRRDSDAFATAAAAVTDGLTGAGYDVRTLQQAAEFLRIEITTATASVVRCDMGVDWRGGEPVRLDIGPVLSVEDAVASKVTALYGRGEARDFLDVDAIRTSGRFSDVALLAAARHRDPDLDTRLFVDQLRSSSRLSPAQVQVYGIDEQELQRVQARYTQWANTLTQSPDPDPDRAGGHEPGRDASSIAYPLQDTANLQHRPDQHRTDQHPTDPPGKRPGPPQQHSHRQGDTGPDRDR